MISILLATRNAHKVEELRAMLPSQCHVVSLSDYPDAPAVIEDANSFRGNASKKSIQLARWIVRSPDRIARLFQPSQAVTGFVVADDSGLEVDALHGAPGVHSARFAASDPGSSTNTPDAANNAKLLQLLANVPLPHRAARFRCVIALSPILLESPSSESTVCHADSTELQTELFEGTCEGHIEFAPRGEHGFGYDPLFVPQGFTESFAQLGAETKNQISHRAVAVRKLCQRLKSLAGG